MTRVTWFAAAAGGAALFAAGYYVRTDSPAAAREVAAEVGTRPDREPGTPVTVTSLRPPNRADRPVLPVTVGRRASAVGRGFVGVVQNGGPAYLRLAATYKNVTTGKTSQLTVSVGPNAAAELSWLEGCPFATGDTLTLTHPNFQSHTWEF